MDSSIVETYNNRLKKTKERLAFKVDYSCHYQRGNVDLIQLKKYFGIKYNNDITILPVFDEIVLSDFCDIASCRIGDLWTIYTIDSGEEVFEHSLASLPIYYDSCQTLEIVNAEGHHGLFDIRHQELVMSPNYDEVGSCIDYDYIWVRKKSGWGFVNKLSHKEIIVDGMDMAYEADGGLFLRMNDRIICVDEDGISNPNLLRNYVVKNQGRGRVHNDKYHQSVFFDVYGIIFE